MNSWGDKTNLRQRGIWLFFPPVPVCLPALAHQFGKDSRDGVDAAAGRAWRCACRLADATCLRVPLSPLCFAPRSSAWATDPHVGVGSRQLDSPALGEPCARQVVGRARRRPSALVRHSSVLSAAYPLPPAQQCHPRTRRPSHGESPDGGDDTATLRYEIACGPQQLAKYLADMRMLVLNFEEAGGEGEGGDRRQPTLCTGPPSAPTSPEPWLWLAPIPIAAPGSVRHLDPGTASTPTSTPTSTATSVPAPDLCPRP